MSNTCTSCGLSLNYKCGCSTEPVYCADDVCLQKMDAKCVYYHYRHPERPSLLTCLGINSDTNLEFILEKIDERLCMAAGEFSIIPMNTWSIDMGVTLVGTEYYIKADLFLDPASTAPVSITPDGLRVDCCDCTGVTTNINYAVNSLEKATNFYTTLQPYYFTKYDYINNYELTDASSVTGDTLTYLKYTLSPLAITVSTTLLSTIDLAVNSCGKDIVNKSFPFLIELMTSNGCYNYKNCVVTTPRVDYSERFNIAYRANFQINDMPIVADPTVAPGIDKGILYFTDVKPFSSLTSNGGVVRKINLNTKETLTLAGNVTGGVASFTNNNTPGNTVLYDYPAGVVIDKTELSNSEPVLYFTTFGSGGTNGGVVCRLVKETNDECDERANWKNYVISGSGNEGDVTPTYPTTASGPAVTFNHLYGLKKWFTVNGAPSFLLADYGNAKIKFIYYKGTGNKNNASSWATTYFGLTIGFNNINVEDLTVGKRLIIFGDGFINFYDFTVSSTPNLAQITTLANYVLTPVINNTSGNVDGPAVGVARVSFVDYIYKYTNPVTSASKYIFGLELVGGAVVNPTTSMLRTFDAITYDFSTLITSNANAVGTSGSPSVTNGESSGFFTDLQLNVYDMTYGGIRQWDFFSGANSSTIFAGGSGVGDTQTEWSGFSTQDYMDTQYEFKINC